MFQFAAPVQNTQPSNQAQTFSFNPTFSIPSFANNPQSTNIAFNASSFPTTQFGTNNITSNSNSTNVMANNDPGNMERIYKSLTNMPSIFNDIRDTVLKQWNQFQAIAGHGKGFIDQTTPPAVFTPDGIFAKFNSIFYNRLITDRDEDGILVLISTKSAQQIETNKGMFLDALMRILGNRPNVMVEMVGPIKEIKDDRNQNNAFPNPLQPTQINNAPSPQTPNKCCISIVVCEKLPDGQVKRASCTQIMNFLGLSMNTPTLTGSVNSTNLIQQSQTTIQQGSNIGKLASTNPTLKSQFDALGIENIIPRVGPTPEQISIYLRNPPLGIDAKIWSRSLAECPNIQQLIPVPVYGFSGLHQRLQALRFEHQFLTKEFESNNHSLSIQQTRLSGAENKLKSMLIYYQKLRHRLLKVKCKQDAYRLNALPLQVSEIKLRAQLEQCLFQLENKLPLYNTTDERYNDIPNKTIDWIKQEPSYDFEYSNNERSLLSSPFSYKSSITSPETLQTLWQEVMSLKQNSTLNINTKTNGTITQKSSSNTVGGTRQNGTDMNNFIAEMKTFISKQQACLDQLTNIVKEDTLSLDALQQTIRKAKIFSQTNISTTL